MDSVQMAAIMIGYIASAAAFYFFAARTAVKVEDKTTSVPSTVSLTVVEGGAGDTGEIRQAA